MKIYRGAPTAARNYVEADRARADDYYLAEGAGVAEHYNVSSSCGLSATRLSREGDLDGGAYESWVVGRDTTGAPKGGSERTTRPCVSSRW
jgi:exodeoxyribonuclease V alpha subunit